MNLILKIIKGQTISDEDIQDELHEICETEHSSCNSNCPVYDINGGEAPNTITDNRGCDCFKNGSKMLTFIKNHINYE